MIDNDSIVKFVIVALVMFVGCGYWLYRENDTGGPWFPRNFLRDTFEV